VILKTCEVWCEIENEIEIGIGETLHIQLPTMPEFQWNGVDWQTLSRFSANRKQQTMNSGEVCSSLNV